MISPPPRSNGSRTLLIVLGVLGLCVVCCCGGGGVLGYIGLQRGKVADGEAKTFARRALLAMGKDWNPQNARAYLSSTWTQRISPQSDVALFGAFSRKLGAIKSLGEFTSSSFYVGSHDGLPSGTRITMTAPAQFAKADGIVRVGVAKLDNTWGIESIKIDSPAFLK